MVFLVAVLIGFGLVGVGINEVDGSKVEWIHWPSPEIVTAYAQLLKSLQWPAVAMVLAIAFRDAIKGLLARMTGGEFWGVKMFFESNLQEMREGAEEVQRDISDAQVMTEAKPSSEVVTEEQTAEERREGETKESAIPGDLRFFKLEREIIETLKVSPPSALMLLSASIESYLRLISEQRGLLPGKKSISVLARELERAGVFSSAFGESLLAFSRIRNQAVHGFPISDNDVARFVDVGIILLRNLYWIAEDAPVSADRTP